MISWENIYDAYEGNLDEESSNATQFKHPTQWIVELRAGQIFDLCDWNHDETLQLEEFVSGIDRIIPNATVQDLEIFDDFINRKSPHMGILYDKVEGKLLCS